MYLLENNIITTDNLPFNDMYKGVGHFCFEFMKSQGNEIAEVYINIISWNFNTLHLYNIILTSYGYPQLESINNNFSITSNLNNRFSKNAS